MGLFQKNPYSTANSQPLYTLGLSKTVLIVGLGNIGKEYELTRHNAGFLTVDAFAEAHDLGGWVNKKDLKCQLVSGNVGNVRVLVIKPTTMMNNSGDAVRSVMDFYKLHSNEIVVVHDELDVTFGQIRCRTGGSSAGHNGIKSVTTHIGADYGRVRIGIGPKIPEQMDSADFVLANFTSDEQSKLKDMKRETTALLTEYVAGGELPHETRSFLVL